MCVFAVCLPRNSRCVQIPTAAPTAFRQGEHHPAFKPQPPLTHSIPNRRPHYSEGFCSPCELGFECTDGVTQTACLAGYYQPTASLYLFPHSHMIHTIDQSDTTNPPQAYIYSLTAT